MGLSGNEQLFSGQPHLCKLPLDERQNDKVGQKEETMRRADREVKDCKEIHQILESCKVCRLGMMDEGKVYIVPMNYGYEYEEGKLVLYFHGAREGKKLRLLGENPSVGIEMDGEHELVAGSTACQYSYYYASIIGDGKAEIITDLEEKSKALALIMKHQTGEWFAELETNLKLGQAVGIIRVEVDEFSCKRHYK